MTLGTFHRNRSDLPQVKQPTPLGDARLTPLAASHWERIGEYLTGAAQHFDVEPEAALAVWMVEAGDLPFVEARPILRLECHKLWENWGVRHPDIFDQHFRFGSHAGVPGASWTNQSYRSSVHDDWKQFHGKQETEYEAFGAAAKLAGLEAACMSSSFGGPQILGSNHAALGYDNATALFTAFGEDIGHQVAGFFDFCQSKNIIRLLRDKNWNAFANTYNGPGQAAVYADHINDAYLESIAFLRSEPLHASLREKRDFDMTAFTGFFAGLNIKHFSAREMVFRGRHHAETAHAAYASNSFPAAADWPNITQTIKALDAFRAHISVSVVLTSIYRSTTYNAAIGGNTASQHTRFAAIDFEVRHALPAAHWAGVLRRLRDQGLFAGAIGLHGNAIHLDTRGENIDF